MAFIKEIRNKKPQIHPQVFVAENATIIGDVIIDRGTSVWYGVVIRGDVNFIRIGKNTNIQDNTTIHATFEKYPTIIGDNVTIGHNAVIHACTIEDLVLVGMGSVIMDNAVVKTGSIIAAGAVVTPGTVVEPYSLYAGVPARKIKDLDKQKAIDEIAHYARNYMMYMNWYKDVKD